VHRIICVYTTLAVLFTHILHALLHYTVYGYYTVHRIIRVYTTLSKAKAPYGATMVETSLPDSNPFLLQYDGDADASLAVARRQVRLGL